MNGFFKRCLAGMLAVSLAFGANAGLRVNAEEADTESTEWMAELSDDAYLSEISIPGTHDSATQYVGLSYIFQCQNTSIAKQLADGYRYFDMRLVLDGDEGEKTLVLKHNFSTCKASSGLFADALTLEMVLDDVYAFLEEHPSETVLLCMKAENGDDDVATVQKLMYGLIDANEELWYTGNEIPTLSEVRGKVVLATRFEDALGVGDTRMGLHFDWEDQGDREIVDVPYVMSTVNDTASLWVQDRYNYATDDKIEAIVDNLENCQASEDTFSINFTSTSGKGYVGHPKKYATAINAYLLDYDWHADTCYGIVVVDFGTEELAKAIYHTN